MPSQLVVKESEGEMDKNEKNTMMNKNFLHTKVPGGLLPIGDGSSIIPSQRNTLHSRFH